LLGRTERSSPNAAERRAEGAGLDGEGADQAIMGVAAMSVFPVIVPFLENVRQTEWQTDPAASVRDYCSGAYSAIGMFGL
jgi:hypothetical protein